MKKVNLFLRAILLAAMLLISCGGVGNQNIVTIGDQLWMKENLNVNKFRNGDIIPEVKTAEEWNKAGDNKQPAWCYYDNDPVNGEKYGKLYNWYAVNDPRGLAPKGYHIPTDAEWTKLSDYLGGKYAAGTKMKSTSGWNSRSKRNRNGNGTNSSDFSGLPGGGLHYNGEFQAIGANGYWWSSTEDDTGSAWYRYLDYNYDDVYWATSNKEDGFSVRCLRD